MTSDESGLHGRIRHSSFHYDQVTPRIVQQFAAGLGANNAILDADAELAGDVDARLVAEDHPGTQRGAIATDQVGLLVDVEAEAVADAVDEVLAVARVCDYL